jgi:hypothetical protein
MIPLIIAGAAALGGAVANGISSSGAAKQLQEGEANARRDIESYTGKAAGYQQPYYDIGTQNTRTLSNMVNNGGFDVNPYSYQQTEQQPQAWNPTEFNFQKDPGYQFQFGQGMNAIQGSAAAGGNLLSGATLKALQKYGNGLANQSYNDAYQRYIQGNQLGMAATGQALGQYNTNRGAGMQNELNRYQSANQQAMQKYGQFSNLANMGQSAAGNLSGLYQGAGANVANTDIGKANAGAAGTMGVGNAVSNGFQTLGNLGSAYYGMNSQQPQQFNMQYGGAQMPSAKNFYQVGGYQPLSNQELNASYTPNQYGW